MLGCAFNLPLKWEPTSLPPIKCRDVITLHRVRCQAERLARIELAYQRWQRCAWPLGYSRTEKV
jgi:hypothetical protein